MAKLPTSKICGMTKMVMIKKKLEFCLASSPDEGFMFSCKCDLANVVWLTSDFAQKACTW